MSATNGVLPPAYGTITFAGSKPLFLQQAAGQNVPTVITGALDVEGTITAENYIVASQNDLPVRIQGSDATQTAFVRISEASGAGNKIEIQNGNDLSACTVSLRDTEIRTNKPLFSLTPTPLVSTASAQSVATLFSLSIDLTGQEAGLYQAVAELDPTTTPVSPSSYNASCAIYWNGTKAVGGVVSFVTPTGDSASISTGLIAGGDPFVKFAVINTVDATLYNATLSLYKMTVDAY